MEDRFTIRPSALEGAARTLSCSLAALQAVVEVESAGRGFLSDGRIKTLFEGHVFWKYTRGRFERDYPSICYQKWTKEHYARGANADERGAGELLRLEQAIALDRTAALMSASYGAFQVMGFNFALCGHTTVNSFYERMCENAEKQLLAFCAYIEHVGLADELRDRRWDAFARKYNGPAFQKNMYDQKLALAYARHVRAAPSAP